MTRQLLWLGAMFVLGCGATARSDGFEGATAGTTPCACNAGEHCEADACVPNVCAPACGPDERCETHGGSTCTCVGGACGAPPVTACNNGVDDDGDGWVDELDPDCTDGGATEKGPGATGCNDGKDNDGDGKIDAADPQCTSGSDDEVTGPNACADACLLGAKDKGKTCTPWDSKAMTWLSKLDDGAGHMHDRARVYEMWLRTRLMPEGGVMRGQFTDGTFDTVVAYSGTRDAPIWTGILTGSEALRLMTTGATDARDQMERSIRVLDRWWRISGDKGYLARFAAPVNAPPQTLAIFDPSNPENHRNVPFEGGTWHWKGNVSRDQYQGVVYGFSLAYEATKDPAVKEMIRADVVAFVEQLMVKQTRSMRFVVDGKALPLPLQVEVDHAVFSDEEMTNGMPTLSLKTSPFDAEATGMLFFWPRPAKYLRQLPGFGWVPDIKLAGQAIQLGAAFAVALQVTDGVPAYAARRQAIQAHYDAHFEEWASIGAGWLDSSQCGDSYHGKNIAFLPAFTWTRAEKDPVRKQRIRDGVVRDAMWPEVADHKNVFFAYLYASQANPADNTAGILATHNAQLALFPVPRTRRGPWTTRQPTPRTRRATACRRSPSTSTTACPRASCGSATRGS